MYKKNYLVMLVFSAMLLTQCKDDGSTPILDAIIAPKVHLTFTTENSRLLFIKAETTEDDANPAYIDLNGNLTKDAGEELEVSKEYKISNKNVTIFGHINSLKIDNQNNLSTIEVQNRFIKELSATSCASLTTCKILKANSLEVIDISGSEAVEVLELSSNENYIKELCEVKMKNPTMIGTEKFKELFIDRLPSRKDKDKKGVLKIESPVFTTDLVAKVQEKGWEFNP